MGGMLYRAALSETATLPVASEQLGEDGHPVEPSNVEEAEYSVRVPAGQELEFFVSDAEGISYAIGSTVRLAVAPQRCFLFSEGKRFYLSE